MNKLGQFMLSSPSTQDTTWPILICLLGNFRLLKAGQPVAVHAGGKTEALLVLLCHFQNFAAKPGAGTDSIEWDLGASWWQVSDFPKIRAGLCLSALFGSASAYTDSLKCGRKPAN